MRSTLFIALVGAVALIDTLLAILLFAFKIDASVSYSDATQNGLTYGFVQEICMDNSNTGIDISQYPEKLHLGPVKTTIASGAISLALALCIGILCLSVWHRGRSLSVLKWPRRSAALLLAFNCVFASVICIVSLINHFRSGSFSPRYRSWKTKFTGFGIGGVYDGVTFDLASWACQITAYSPFNDDGQVLRRQCIDETATLCIWPLLTFANFLLTGLIWRDWKGPRHFICDGEKEMDDEELNEIW